jgi:hypothetical protein
MKRLEEGCPDSLTRARAIMTAPLHSASFAGA